MWRWRLQNTTVSNPAGCPHRNVGVLHCQKDATCCCMYLSNACFHTQSYLHYAYLMTLLCFWMCIPKATGDFFTSDHCLLQTTAPPQHLHSTERGMSPPQNVFPLLLPCLTPRGTVSQHNTAKKQQQLYGWEQWHNSKRVFITVNPVSWLTSHLSIFF